MLEDQQSEGIPPGLLAGRLEGVRLPDLMWALCQRRATGVLEIGRGRICRRLFITEGRIVFASSSDPNDRLGEMLLRQGRISLEQLEEALRRLRSGKRLGALLVEAGTLDPEQLVHAVMAQVKTIVLDVLTWDEGEYRFEPGRLPTQEVITLQMHTSELLLLAIRDIRSFSRIRASVGPSRTVYSLADDWKVTRESLTLTPAEQLIVSRLQRGVASVQRLCEELTVSNFEIYQALWAFKVLGLTRELEWVREPRGETGIVGRLGEEGFPEVLMRVIRSGLTGVLYISRRHIDRSLHIQEGQCRFATSTDPDDGLVAYLLRRGFISLQDREETSKRLLSNKRVGTILLQLGVLDERDLIELVRQQLSEIVYDTFRWDEGEYLFVGGPLPSNEEITLDVDIATLVGQGIRRINSWTRVIRGCGGVDNPLTLSENYLEVLDRLAAGVEEMDVVNTLKHPQSARRVCRLVDVDDFRACQILWTLRLLGAAETPPIEDIDDVLADLPQPEPDEADPGEAVRAELKELPDQVHLLSRTAVDAGDMVGPPPSPGTMTEGIERSGPEFPPPAAARAEVQFDAGSLEDLPTEGAPGSLPDGVDQLIGRFNAMHRLVYDAVRAEIGAGAVNFVRSCCGHVSSGGLDVLTGVELLADGTWDADGLKRTIAENRIEDPWTVYQRVLDREFVLLAPHLGERRANALKQQIWSIAQSG